MTSPSRKSRCRKKRRRFRVPRSAPEVSAKSRDPKEDKADSMKYLIEFESFSSRRLIDFHVSFSNRQCLPYRKDLLCDLCFCLGPGNTYFKKNLNCGTLEWVRTDAFDIDRDFAVVGRGCSTDNRSNEHGEHRSSPATSHYYFAAPNCRPLFPWCLSFVRKSIPSRPGVRNIVPSTASGPGLN